MKIYEPWRQPSWQVHQSKAELSWHQLPRTVWWQCTSSLHLHQCSCSGKTPPTHHWGSQSRARTTELRCLTTPDQKVRIHLNIRHNPQHLIEVDDVELSELIITMTNNINCRVIIKHGQWYFIFMNIHVVDVKSNVGGGFSDVNTDLHFSSYGEVVRYDEGH